MYGWLFRAHARRATCLRASIARHSPSVISWITIAHLTQRGLGPERAALTPSRQETRRRCRRWHAQKHRPRVNGRPRSSTATPKRPHSHVHGTRRCCRYSWLPLSRTSQRDRLLRQLPLEHRREADADHATVMPHANGKFDGSGRLERSGKLSAASGRAVPAADAAAHHANQAAACRHASLDRGFSRTRAEYFRQVVRFSRATIRTDADVAERSPSCGTRLAASSRRGPYADCGASCCRRRRARPCRGLRPRVWTGAACVALGPEGPHGDAGCRPRLADAPRGDVVQDEPRPRFRPLWSARADGGAGAIAWRPRGRGAHGGRPLSPQLPGVSRSRGQRRAVRDQVGGRPGARGAARRASRADEGAAPATRRGGGTRAARARSCGNSDSAFTTAASACRRGST